MGLSELASAAVSATPVGHDEPPSPHPLEPLFDVQTVRLRCAPILRAVERDLSPYFTLDRTALPAVAERVAALALKRFPDLRIPYHSRWRHFEAGGVHRKAELDAALQGQPVTEQARVHIDLTVVSVLLDAGAGTAWKYREERQLQTAAKPHADADELLAALDRVARAPAAPAAPEAASSPPPSAPAGAVFTRSEGLGVATFRAFMAGAFSSSKTEPLRADAQALRHIDAAALRAVFQAGPANSMVGLEGRASVIARLGQSLSLQPGQRPGHLFDRLVQTPDGSPRASVGAATLLREVLRLLDGVWPSGSRVQGLPAGDVWPHRWAGAATAQGASRTTDGYVPFHKLSQWLAYSLLEPLQWAGVEVTGLDALTGLPEYRNGGLLIDAGVLVPRSPRLLERTWKPADEFIVEWRALTIALLDEVAVLVRERLGVSAEQMPLACVLEAGTWAAGREIAGEKREGGAPPVKIDSDGTVF